MKALSETMVEKFISCQVCGFKNAMNATICAKCSHVLQVETNHMTPPEELLSDPRYGSREAGKWVAFHVHGSNASVEVELEEGVTHIIGRHDPATNTLPGVDLSRHRGAELGVSRKHALLTYVEGALRVADNGSANGTFLNNHRLFPDQARMLRDGDELRFGHLTVSVQFS